MVVGWCTDDVLRTAFDDEQVAILNAGYEPDALTSVLLVDGCGELLVQILDEQVGIGCFQIAAVVGDYFSSPSVMMLQRRARSSS